VIIHLQDHLAPWVVVPQEREELSELDVVDRLLVHAHLLNAPLSTNSNKTCYARLAVLLLIYLEVHLLRRKCSIINSLRCYSKRVKLDHFKTIPDS
jgi:hypothetical protein